MKILSNGIDPSGKPIVPPIEEKKFIAQLRDSLTGNVVALKKLTDATNKGMTFRGEAERIIRDPGDPHSVGWTWLVNSKDPSRKKYAEAISKFASYRGMKDPASPLYFNGENPSKWFDWLSDKYLGLILEGKTPPLYILIVGGPDQVPFLFQSLLSTVANVGRISFDSIEDLKTYLDKVVRLESAPKPVVDRTVTLFAPDGGPKDPTYFSRQYMVEPINDHIQTERKFKTKALLAQDATKGKLSAALQENNPALVFTASHGMGFTGEPMAKQLSGNGSIVCQHGRQLTEESLFSAADVPMGKPFLEGSLFFQFACFGYGTPAQSDFTHWFGEVPKRYADYDFVSALPKQLLKHPQGPIGYIGHLDVALLIGFTDADNPNIAERWHSRVSPFVSMIDNLLETNPPGLSMRGLNDRYNICNAVLTNLYDLMKRKGGAWKPETSKTMMDQWLMRSDAQNYLLLGDPAAHLRIPEN